MKAIATYCVRVDKKRLHQIKDHWEHHKPLCLNGVVCLNHEDFTVENIEYLVGLGLEVRQGIDTKDFDRNLSVLAEEASKMEGKWFLTLDSDEYISPHQFTDIALATYEAETSGQEWLRGWICDRFSEGGEIKPEPKDFTYVSLSQQHPVMTDVTSRIQGSCTEKCFMALKPNIGLIHRRSGEPYPRWFRIDHFKWMGDCIQILEDRKDNKWAHQFFKAVEHYNQHGRFRVDKHLSNMWDHVHGWFDFWDLYMEVVEALPAEKVQIVEVGVWQGRSSLFLSQYAMAKGVDYELWLVDKFKGCEATAAHLHKIDRCFNHKSDFLHKVAQMFHQNNSSQRTNFIQSDSVRASRLFDDNSLHFVFIDDDHSEQAVRAGNEAWFPKVIKGGVIAGHDYNHHSVYKAVNAFFGQENVEQRGNSWMVRK